MGQGIVQLAEYRAWPERVLQIVGVERVNPAKAYARMNPSRPQIRIRTSGGEPDITPESVSYARVGLEKMCDLAGLMVFGGDHSGDQYLADLLLARATEIAYREAWNYKKGQLAKLCQLAVAEMGYPQQLKTDKSKAIFLGISRQWFNEKYKKRYEAVWQLLNDCTNKAFQHVDRRLNTDE